MLGKRIRYNKKMLQLVTRLNQWTASFLKTYIKYRRKQDFLQLASTYFAERTVKSGPFAGLLYPGLTAYGSVLLPKLAGYYERELHPVLEAILKDEFEVLIDIGCAEGYYAIGVTKAKPGVITYAIDTNPEALLLCKEMARLNGCSDRVHTLDSIDVNTLSQLTLSKKALIISDCEGYEAELFTKTAVSFLRNATLIIELHPFVKPGVARELYLLFMHTHTIELIESEELSERMLLAKEQFSSFKNENHIEYLVAENRPQTMEWMVCRPKEVMVS